MLCPRLLWVVHIFNSTSNEVIGENVVNFPILYSVWSSVECPQMSSNFLCQGNYFEHYPSSDSTFNISIRLGKVPNEWKIACVSLIPKSNNCSDPANYRPIPLLSVLSKLLEKHIRNLLIGHFEEHYPLTAQQWGFSSGRSTTGALLAATDQWQAQATGFGSGYLHCFFDCSKAFDTVPHYRS